MWTRSELKINAKEFLKKHYWKAFLVALVIAIATSGGTSGGDSHSNTSQSNFSNKNFSFDVPFLNTGDGLNDNASTVESAVSKAVPWMWGVAFGLGGVVIILVIAVALGFKIFIAAPLEVGGRSFFTKGAEFEEEVHFAHLGMAFRKTHYFNIVVAMFYRSLMTFLFFLLLIIPGIIKSYAYSLVPYLLADNPQLDPDRALKLSEQMTSGQKMDIFVLDLSFIGWYILGGLFFGIGFYFVNPYAYATKAQLYLVLKANAINNGICSPSELVWTKAFVE